MSEQRHIRLVRIVGGLSLAVWFVANTVLWDHYVATRPRTPNTATGNVYALNSHGSVVYLTFADAFVLYGALGTALTGAFFAIAWDLRRRGWTLR